MNEQPIQKQALMSSLPPESWDNSLPNQIRSLVRQSGTKVVVIDDDPLGTQTVYDLPVLTEWPVESLAREMENELPAFYVLTNSRSMTASQAALVNAEVGRNLLEASQLAHRNFTVISRSDSTLRGHFPEEVQALADALGSEFDAWLLIPFFLEGGRFTINDVHYVAEGDTLVPAGMTEFARDAVFGYHSSNLHEWVEEKTNGRISSSSVYSVSIEDIRIGGASKVVDRLLEVPLGGVCIVNAVTMSDLSVFTLGLLELEKTHRRYLYRTASSFVQSRLGLEPRQCLSPNEAGLRGFGPGLVVVGSHVPKTSMQLAKVLERPGIHGIEVDVPGLLGARREREIIRASALANSQLAQGYDTVIYTSRQALTGKTREQSLLISHQISRALVQIVRSITVRPRYLLLKGGITASDVCTSGLGVRRAMVLGQLLPGVPVWQLGNESRWPHLLCVVFPGNVGDADALVEAMAKLSTDC